MMLEIRRKLSYLLKDLKLDQLDVSYEDMEGVFTLTSCLLLQ